MSRVIGIIAAFVVMLLLLALTLPVKAWAGEILNEQWGDLSNWTQSGIDGNDVNATVGATETGVHPSQDSGVLNLRNTSSSDGTLTHTLSTTAENAVIDLYVSFYAPGDGYVSEEFHTFAEFQDASGNRLIQLQLRTRSNAVSFRFRGSGFDYDTPYLPFGKFFRLTFKITGGATDTYDFSLDGGETWELTDEPLGGSNDLGKIRLDANEDNGVLFATHFGPVIVRDDATIPDWHEDYEEGVRYQNIFASGEDVPGDMYTDGNNGRTLTGHLPENLCPYGNGTCLNGPVKNHADAAYFVSANEAVYYQAGQEYYFESLADSTFAFNDGDLAEINANTAPRILSYGEGDPPVLYAAYLFGSEGESWSMHNATASVYKCTTLSPDSYIKYVFIKDGLALREVNDEDRTLDECVENIMAQNDGTFYWDSANNDLYVRMWDDADPSSSDIMIRTNNETVFRWRVDYTTVEPGFVFWYGNPDLNKGEIHEGLYFYDQGLSMNEDTAYKDCYLNAWNVSYRDYQEPLLEDRFSNADFKLIFSKGSKFISSVATGYEAGDIANVNPQDTTIAFSSIGPAMINIIDQSGCNTDMSEPQRWYNNNFWHSPRNDEDRFPLVAANPGHTYDMKGTYTPNILMDIRNNVFALHRDLDAGVGRPGGEPTIGINVFGTKHLDYGRGTVDYNLILQSENTDPSEYFWIASGDPSFQIGNFTAWQSRVDGLGTWSGSDGGDPEGNSQWIDGLSGVIAQTSPAGGAMWPAEPDGTLQQSIEGDISVLDELIDLGITDLTSLDGVVLIEDGVVQVDTLYVGAYQDDSLLSGEEEDPPYILNDALPDVLNRAISVPLSCTDQDAEWGVDDDAQAIGMAVEDGCLVCEGCGPGDYAVTLTACNCAGCDEYLYEFTVMEPVAVAAFTPWGMGAAFCGLLAMGAAAIRRRQ